MAERRVLVDTGATYAFVTRNDAHHTEAREFVRSCLERRGSFVLADVVFVETMTLLKVRLGSAVAIRVGRELRENPVYTWAALETEGERDTWALFEKYDDEDWSYTDCALLALSRRKKIRRVFTFDRHVSQMPGVERVPAMA